MNGFSILVICVLVILLILSFSSKSNKDTKEEDKEEIKEDRHYSSYINNYHHESEYDGYPKVIKSKRKGEEGMLVLIERPGAKGRLIYGQREDDIKPYGRRSTDI